MPRGIHVQCLYQYTLSCMLNGIRIIDMKQILLFYSTLFCHIGLDILNPLGGQHTGALANPSGSILDCIVVNPIICLFIYTLSRRIDRFNLKFQVKFAALAFQGKST